MAKRSSVAVIASMPTAASAMCDNESLNIDVRKIDNGYVTRESSYKGDKYESRETFSRDKPNIEAGRASANPGRETLRDAMKALK